MTLPESLARKALPCHCRAGEPGWPPGHSTACPARLWSAVEAVLREMVEACAEIAVTPGGHWQVGMKKLPWWDGKKTATAIRALLTEEETP